MPSLVRAYERELRGGVVDFCGSGWQNSAVGRKRQRFHANAKSSLKQFLRIVLQNWGHKRGGPVGGPMKRFFYGPLLPLVRVVPVSSKFAISVVFLRPPSRTFSLSYYCTRGKQHWLMSRTSTAGTRPRWHTQRARKHVKGGRRPAGLVRSASASPRAFFSCVFVHYTAHADGYSRAGSLLAACIDEFFTSRPGRSSPRFCSFLLPCGLDESSSSLVWDS